MENYRKIRSSLDLWNHLVSAQLGEEKLLVLHHNSQNVSMWPEIYISNIRKFQPKLPIINF